MAKLIVHSSIDERGKATGGVAGDQTQREVCIREWYDMLANHVLHIENEAVRNQFANNMIDIANNDNVGYDQNGRNTLLTEAIKADFDFRKITVKCESDCSSMVTIALLGAIYTVLGKEAYLKAYEILVQNGNCATTRTLRGRMLKLTVIALEVTVYSSSDYTRSTANAHYGDIFLKEGTHVVVYIGDGKKVERTLLEVDGQWGRDTTEKTQIVFDTVIDGEISHQLESCKPYLDNCLVSSWKFDDTRKGSLLIRTIQTFLAYLGYYKGEIDGLCGKKTVMAIQTFLASLGLYDGEIDGEMGPKTVTGWQMYINSRL